MTNTLSISRLALAMEALLRNSRNTLEDTIAGRDVDAFMLRVVAHSCQIAAEMPWISGTNLIPASAYGNRELPAHDPETGELEDFRPGAADAAERLAVAPQFHAQPEQAAPPAEPAHDRDEQRVDTGPDAPLGQQPGEPTFPAEDAPAVVDDVGAGLLNDCANRLEAFFRQPADTWAKVSAGMTDERVAELVRVGNADKIESARQHHPEIHARMIAILEAGRVSA